MSTTTYPYVICDGCGAEVHQSEASPVNGPYGEFREPGTAYFCWRCYADIQLELEGKEALYNVGLLA